MEAESSKYFDEAVKNDRSLIFKGNIAKRSFEESRKDLLKLEEVQRYLEQKKL